NRWSWQPNSGRPILQQIAGNTMANTVEALDTELGKYYLYCDRDVPMLFTENETNMKRVFGVENRSLYVKDGINEYVVHGQTAAVNPARQGTKVAPHYLLTVEPARSEVIRLRLSNVTPDDWAKTRSNPFGNFEDVLQARRSETDEFYKDIIPKST